MPPRSPLSRLAVLALVALPLATARGERASEEPTRAEERAFRAAVERVAAAVVRIEPAGAVAADAAAGSGAPSSGVVIDAAGLIVTTPLVVPEHAAAAVVVLSDGRRIGARVRGRDEPRGLVLLRSDPLDGIPPLEAVSRRALEPGQWTIAVGRGWGHATPAVAVGVLSAVDRCWGRVVQTDAAISPANYGGALVDIRGRVIGVLVPPPADATGPAGGADLYDSGIGFAVPLEDVRAVRDRLDRGDTLVAGLLGVTYRSRDALTGAPVIGSCRQGSPAALAGLRPGDRIVAVDGRPTPRIADVRHRIAPRYAGDEVALAVERPGDEARLERTLTLAATLPPWRRAVLGLTVAPGPGLAVDWVLPGGPADRAGIAGGDRIESAAIDGGEPVRLDDAAALAALLEGLAPGDAIALAARRGTESLSVVVPTAGAPGDPPAVAASRADATDAAVVKLAAAEVPKPPLAVLPGGTRPAGVLVFLGPPGETGRDRAEAWRRAAGRHGVAVILPEAESPRGWGRADVPGIGRAIESLAARRPIDRGRIAVAGRGADGFAWSVADALGPAVRGVALLDAGLPARAVPAPAEPARDRWVLLPASADGPLGRSVAADRRRLEDAGHAVGALPPVAGAEAVAETLCRWAAILDLM